MPSKAIGLVESMRSTASYIVSLKGDLWIVQLRYHYLTV